MRALLLIVGIACILWGIWMLLCVIGFASIIDPSLSDAEWWSEFRDRVFNRALGDEVVCLTWIAFGSLGVWLGAKKNTGQSDPKSCHRQSG